MCNTFQESLWKYCVNTQKLRDKKGFLTPSLQPVKCFNTGLRRTVIFPIISCAYLLQTKREVKGSMAKNIFFITFCISFFSLLKWQTITAKLQSPIGLCEGFAKHLTIYQQLIECIWQASKLKSLQLIPSKQNTLEMHTKSTVISERVVIMSLSFLPASIHLVVMI